MFLWKIYSFIHFHRTEKQHGDDKLSTEEMDDEVSLPLDMTLSEDEHEDDQNKNLKQTDPASNKDDDDEDSFWERCVS